MRRKQIVRPWLPVILALLLSTCGPATLSAAPTAVDVAAIRTQATGAAALRMTQIAALTPTAIPTDIPTPTPTPGKPFTLDDLRRLVPHVDKENVYVDHGNVFIEVGNHPPLRLTHSGKDRDPILSDDGRKVVFYRGTAFDNVYSIDADGTHEKSIVISKSLAVLGRGADVKALTFVPKTHFLLFNTYLCDPVPEGPSYNAPDCTVSLYSVDTDTGKTSELIAGLSGNTMQHRNFEIAPDGKHISVAASGHLDIYFLDTIPDHVDLSNEALRYGRTMPDEYLPVQYWLPDSSALIAVIADSSSNEPGTPPHNYAVWRYTFRNITAAQIPFDPPITYDLGCNFSVSPDRNWIVYHSDDGSLYIGNLNDDHVQPYEGPSDCPSTYYSSPQWSPDSKYFAFQTNIGSVDGSSIPIGGGFVDWIDVSHYSYFVGRNINDIKTYAAELGGGSVLVPDDFWTAP